MGHTLSKIRPPESSEIKEIAMERLPNLILIYQPNNKFDRLGNAFKASLIVCDDSQEGFVELCGKSILEERSSMAL